MNNPFTSDRNLFTNLPKPVRQTEQKLSSQLEGVPKSYLHQIPSPTISNNNMIGMGSKISGVSSNGGIGGKTDLNFRGEFRNGSSSSNSNFGSGKNGNTGNGYQNYLVSDASDSSNSIRYNTLNTGSSNGSSKPRQISEKSSQLYPITATTTNPQHQSYNLSSTTPTTTISAPLSAQVLNQNLIKSNKTTINKPIIQKQKITFGVPSKEESNTKQFVYDKNGFVNRQEFVNMEPMNNFDKNNNNNDDNQYDKNQKNNRYVISDIKIPQTYPIPQPNLQKLSNFPTISMSPIQQISKHKIDQSNQQQSMGFNIDLMGDDIDRILASSKNQEELCRLLGIENTGRGKIEEIGCRKDGKNLGSFYNNNNNNNNNNIGNNYNTTNTPNRPNSSTPKNNLPQNEINSVPLISVSHPSQSTKYPNFIKKNTAPQSQSNFISNKKYENGDGNFNVLGMYGNYNNNCDDKDEEVFNYQQETVSNYYSTPNPHPKPIIPITTNTSNQLNSIKMGKTFQNTNIPSPNLTNNDSLLGNNNLSAVYISQLQNAIDGQMKKLAMKGKVRTFLSAAQKIETVKYNMGYI